MDIPAIASSALMMKASQTRESISISIMKQAAQQQNQLADLLAGSARPAAQLAAEAGSGFSVYA